jgi:hypothetical protein
MRGMNPCCQFLSCSDAATETALWLRRTWNDLKGKGARTHFLNFKSAFLAELCCKLPTIFPFAGRGYSQYFWYLSNVSGLSPTMSRKIFDLNSIYETFANYFCRLSVGLHRFDKSNHKTSADRRRIFIVMCNVQCELWTKLMNAI